MGITIREATEKWVGTMNTIPTNMIAKLIQADYEEWREVTVPMIGDKVEVWDIPETSNSHYGIIETYNPDDGSYTIMLNDNVVVDACKDDFYVCREDELPMWGTMWSFGSDIDDYWLTNMGGLEIMSNHGFRIYESDEFGYFFGIDGAGYDFYSEHWIPLYKERGLHWHDIEDANI